MSKISKKIKPRDLNYERLTNKYNEEEATQQQKIMTNIILNLYQTSFIRTYKMAEKLIDKYRQPVANKAKQHKQFRDQMIKYISVKPKFLNRTDTLIDEGNKKIEQIDDARLINDVEHIDNDKALTTIKINLNTKAAFPDMPDLTEDGSRASTTIDESFENGAPNRDVNYELLIARIKDKILELTSDVLSNKESMKIQLGGNFQLYRLKNHESGHIEYIQHNMYCKTKVMNITKLTLNDIIDNLINDLGDKLLSEKQQDSGWKIRRIVGIFIQAYKTRPARGASYIETPIRYNFPKNGLINIRNDDLCCFKWCMKYHQTKKGKHDDRITVLKKVKDNFNYDGINFPTSYDDIAHFEKVNKVSIFIYVIGQKGQILKERCGCIEYANKPILLLRLEDEDKSHYVYIKDISKLLCLSVKRKDQSFKHCLYCDKFVLRDIHDKHISECYKMCYNTCVACLPEEGSKMRFKNHKNKIQRPFIIYSDCEAALKKLNQTLCKKKDVITTTLISRHDVNSCCYYFVCTFDPTRNYIRTFEGDDCIYDMIKEMQKVSSECIQELKSNKKMYMTEDDFNSFNNATVCHICDEEFDDSVVVNKKGKMKKNKLAKVRDHDHLTGKYRGAAHSCCNINYFSNRYVPVVFHNLRGYDSHLIIKEAYRLVKGDISVIPNSSEKFMSFKIGNLRFIDSFQFLACGLETLVNNLHGNTEENKYDSFNAIKSIYPDDYEILCRKGFYPYEWVDNLSKLDHEGLPPIEDFYSMLYQKGLTEDEYKHACYVYNQMKCKNFRDYHMIYLKTDVLLLADVFENFRKTCIQHYKLDPANYISAPSLAWDAMMYKTGVVLDLVSDFNIMTMIEEQKRGGLCFVGSKRYAKANNKYMGNDYDENNPDNFIVYWDMNNLYGCAMIDYLPSGGHQFVYDYDLENILKTADDSPTGYLLRVDLTFPKETHELFRQYPPAPENTAPKKEWLSDYQNEIAKDKQISINNICKQTKLIPHLYKHEKYVIDYRNLKYLVSLGVKIDCVYDVISYNQSRWLKPYIDFNTEMRKHAKNDFEKDFFKLMNNSVYGKTMENVKNRMEMHLTTSEENAVKWFSKDNLKTCSNVFDLYMIEMYKTKVVLDKPIYVGTTILDLSKLLMMKYHYDVIEKQFKGRYELLYSDTDSLVYQIYCEDLYKWMGENKGLFDLSESANPNLRDDTNKKKLGVMKDELNSLPIIEFISLCSKCYSYTYKKNIEIKNVKKIKGVSKSVVKNNIKHEDYKNVLNTGKSISKPVVAIRSFNHQLMTIKQEKMCLNSWYDKARLVDAVSTQPYGYNV